MNLLCKLLLWAVMISFLAAGAKAQEAVQVRGVFCNEPAQLEMLVAYVSDKNTVQEAIVLINEANGPRQSCGVATVLGVPQKAAKTIESPDGLLDVIPVEVIMYQTPYGVSTLEKPQVWYTLMRSEKKGA